MGKPPKPSPHWTTVREYVTSKSPDDVWYVQRHTAGYLRCNCPGFIFSPSCGACVDRGRDPKTVRLHERDAEGHRSCPTHGRPVPHGPVQPVCKHIVEYLLHPDIVVTPKAADEFGMAVRKAFEKRFDGILALPPRYTKVVVAKLPLEERERWRGFIDDLRLLCAAPAPAPAPSTAPGLYVRRIVLD